MSKISSYAFLKKKKKELYCKDTFVKMDSMQM